MKVYVVTHGYYSDESIVGVFSTEGAAEDYAATSDEGAVCEWEVDETQASDRVECFAVAINASSGDDVEKPCSYWVDRDSYRANQQTHEEFLESGVIRVTSIRSLDHARKIAIEMRQSFLHARRLDCERTG